MDSARKVRPFCNCLLRNTHDTTTAVKKMSILEVQVIRASLDIPAAGWIRVIKGLI